MTTIKTTQGDTWDIIAKRIYDNEMLMNVLIKANFKYRKIAIFPAGVVLNVPEIDTTAIVNDSDLPVWKRE